MHRALIGLAVVFLALGFPHGAAAQSEIPDHWIAVPPDCSDTTDVSNLKAEVCGPAAGGDDYDAGDEAALGTPALATPMNDDRTYDVPAYCRYEANVLFYSYNFPTELARAMRAVASPCATYWIHVRARDTNKLACLPNQAPNIRGPRFHAMCEAHVSGWQQWVGADPAKRTWYQAGVRLRQQMVLDGFDVAQGDTWSLNEVSSAVRRGDGNARANVLEFMRGLYDGGPDLPDVMGNVFVAGLGQETSPTSVYKGILKQWLAEDDFWQEAAKYALFWGQEVYSDVRYTLAPGEPRARRAESLGDYLEQVWMLADAGPDEIQVARSFLQTRHYPVASAAWMWAPDLGFGFTEVPVDAMKNFVGVQGYAMRHYLGSHPQGMAPTVGYAWHLRRPNSVPAQVFRNQWELDLLPMFASSVAGMFGPGGSSQIGACGEDGDHVWCDGEWESASFNREWELLRNWD